MEISEGNTSGIKPKILPEISEHKALIQNESLLTWEKEPALDIIAFADKISKMPVLEGKFSNTTQELKNNLQNILLKKNLSSQEKSGRIYTLLNKQEKYWLKQIFEQLFNSPDLTIITDININNLAYYLASYILPETDEAKSFKGIAFQRILTESFMLMNSLDLKNKIEQLSNTTKMIISLLGPKNKHKAFNNLQDGIYTHTIGAASSTAGLLIAKDFLSKKEENVNFLLTASFPLWDKLYKIDSLIWDSSGQKIKGVVGAKTRQRLDPKTCLEIKHKGKKSLFQQKEYQFNRDKILRSLLVSFNINDLPYGENTIMTSIFQKDINDLLKGSVEVVRRYKNLISPDLQVFFHVSNLKDAGCLTDEKQKSLNHTTQVIEIMGQFFSSLST